MDKKVKPYTQQEELTIPIVSDTVINEPDSKEYIMSGLKEAFRELKEIKAGKGKTYSVEEVLKEMREEIEVPMLSPIQPLL